MKTQYKVLQLKIGGIFGNLYYRKEPNQARNLVIYGIGAPVIPDPGNLPDARIIMQYDTDLFVPDYIGYARSDGVHTPMNCVQTFLDLYDQFTDGCTGVNKYSDVSIHLQYDRILFAGKSYGGIYVPLLPRFNSEIKEICVIYGSVNNAACDDFPELETNDKFMTAMRENGYHHLYRGILNPMWEKHLNNEDDLAPVQPQNVAALTEAKVFIGHGTEDPYIHYSIAEDYYNRIIAAHPEYKSNYKLKLYKGGHDSKVSAKIMRDFLNWVGVEKAVN